MTFVSPSALFGRRAQASHAQHAEGWAPARTRCSSLNHYFRDGVSLCRLHNTGPVSPTVQRVARANDCQHCKRMLEKAGQA